MKYVYLFLLLTFAISCRDRQKATETIKAKPLMSLAETHVATVDVLPVFLGDVKDWKELKAIDSFFVKFRKISPNEALSNALELKDLIKQLKDSVKPLNFEIPSFNARINILNNEVLRLADLIDIGAIEATEINSQVVKTMSAFSDVNTKINTLLAKRNFEDDIDIELKFIGLDSTKMDSISKNSVNRRLKEQARNDKLRGKSARKKQ